MTLQEYLFQHFNRRHKDGGPGGADYESEHLWQRMAEDGWSLVNFTPDVTARATQAVLDYYDAHPEAGTVPHFHHREALAKAVMRELVK